MIRDPYFPSQYSSVSTRTPKAHVVPCAIHSPSLLSSSLNEPSHESKSLEDNSEFYKSETSMDKIRISVDQYAYRKRNIKKS